MFAFIGRQHLSRPVVGTILDWFSCAVAFAGGYEAARWFVFLVFFSGPDLDFPERNIADPFLLLAWTIAMAIAVGHEGDKFRGRRTPIIPLATILGSWLVVGASVGYLSGYSTLNSMETGTIPSGTLALVSADTSIDRAVIAVTALGSDDADVHVALSAEDADGATGRLTWRLTDTAVATVPPSELSSCTVTKAQEPSFVTLSCLAWDTIHLTFAAGWRTTGLAERTAGFGVGNTSETPIEVSWASTRGGDEWQYSGSSGEESTYTRGKEHRQVLPMRRQVDVYATFANQSRTSGLNLGRDVALVILGGAVYLSFRLRRNATELDAPGSDEVVPGRHERPA